MKNTQIAIAIIGALGVIVLILYLRNPAIFSATGPILHNKEKITYTTRKGEKREIVIEREVE